MGYNEVMSAGKKGRHPFLVLALSVLAAGTAFAHPPRFVSDQPSIVIRDPDFQGRCLYICTNHDLPLWSWRTIDPSECILMQENPGSRAIS